ncbi:alkaline phosphatase family protein [Teredinibacter turnerae]|uniref:alkaline phosphatase family protein n=1 Tax=Teredinibacter turnerae TaxID=2426 RepID=UPI00035E4032|nr:alkaline phosphatase family protein [Teredinibacter turnerae]
MKLSVQPRVFVFGVSGATWDVITPLANAGRLPNIRKLIDGGVSGVLASVRPEGDKHFRPQTAWPCLSTGRRPESHGILRYFHTAAEMQVPSIWQLISDTGRNVGTYSWPMTWPPKEINGFDIPCYHARDRRTWPPELEDIRNLDRQSAKAVLDREGAARLRLLESLRMAQVLARYNVLYPMAGSLLRSAARVAFSASAEERTLELRHAKQQLACGLFLDLCRRYQPDASAFVTFLVDYISHRYWRYHEPEKFGEAPATPAIRNAVINAYIAVDNMLGRILQRMDSNTVVAFVSEHGMAAEPDSTEHGDWHYVINAARLKQFAGLDEHIHAHPIARWVAYRRDDGAPIAPAEVEKLQSLVVVETGEPLFQVFNQQHEIIVKFNLATDVAFYRQANLENLHIAMVDKQIGFSELARRNDRRRSAMHAEDAVFILHGPGIKRGASLQGAEIIDIAPTLLCAAGIQTSAVFDGKVLDVFGS